MKFPITPLALALMAGPLCAQSTDTEKRIADLEKKIEKLTKAESKKEEAKESGVTVKFGGRFHLDAVQFDGARNRLPAGTFMRRARISFKAGFGKDWAAEGDVDFAESSVGIKDMWLGYQGFDNTLIQIGQFKAPFGFDTLTSSNATWFMERSYSDIWTPDRHVGIAYQTWGTRWMVKANFFGQAIDDTSDAQEAADSNTDSTGLVKSYKIIDNHGWGYAARAAFTPVMKSAAKAIHLGVATVTRKPNAAAPGVYAVDFSGRPEQNKVAREKFLNASVTNVDKWSQYGFEFVGVWGPFSWQSEYQQTKVFRRGTQMQKWDGTKLVATSAAEQAASVIDHKFDTYYGQVSWMFGGQRTYDQSEGLFGKVSPSKKGALEIVARYSRMNQDDLTAVDPVKGGIAHNLSVGLTYYLNKNVRFMLNRTHVSNNENAMANKAYSPTGSKLPYERFDIYSARVQVNF
ncbi:OprO/OprP family phosphate-selective porin [Mesoterricola sediminis]|uniref:Porin n=1 Tax=Mesoterricola sediminis TaxID=2927980 RepID=A0AA48GWQ0_9BACT|nr:porin [Mesoterricola sediminis]BDU77669.1 porin [Mesoterricola sediminis]